MISFDRLVNWVKLVPTKIEMMLPKKFIKREFCLGKKKKKELYVLFPHWWSTYKTTVFIKHNILSAGYSYLGYELPGGILSGDAGKTLKSFLDINQDATRYLKKLAKKHKFSKINVVGVSLGGVNACMLTNNNRLVDTVDLIAPGNCLAEAMWKGGRTQWLRKKYEKKGVSLKKLKEAWSEIAPENNLGGFGGKRVCVKLSKADEVVPYSCGKSLVKKMRACGIKPLVETNDVLGHYITAFKFYLDPWDIIPPK